MSVTDERDVYALIHWCETNSDPIPDPDEVVQIASEWLTMQSALMTMATSDDKWHVYKTPMRDYARKALGMEASEDD